MINILLATAALAGLVRGNTNVDELHPIDSAAWVWAPGSDVWGDSSANDVWDMRQGTEGKFPSLYRFRKTFTSDGTPLKLEVSADERFILYLDGKEVARGPLRGLVTRWHFQDLTLNPPAGTHTLEAVAGQMGLNAPFAQLSYRGGFILKAAGSYDAQLTTGKAEWEVAPITGTTIAKNRQPMCFGIGTGICSVGTGFTAEEPASNAWQKVHTVRAPVGRNHVYGYRLPGWMLYPADRPSPILEPTTPGKIVNADIDVTKPFTIPAHTTQELYWDLGNYYCAYPELSTSRGKGATVDWGWLESPHDKDNHKGNRDAWQGKSFSGSFGDTFVCDGRADAFFTTPWWRPGRWCVLTITTQDEPLDVKSLTLLETHYPLQMDAEFSCDDPDIAPIEKICRRAMQMCMHEMLFDCPYYEQQMYPGDSRIQLQILDALTRDPRMPQFCMSIYDYARRDDGFVPMNFPSRGLQDSATYSMCWVMMFGDELMWHNSPDFLRARMPGVRNTLMNIALYENADGLVEGLPGWNFMDWVYGKQEFVTGLSPKDNGKGVSALENLQYLLALESAAKVDAALGETELAAHWQAKIARVKAGLLKDFWDEGKGVLADTPSKTRFSEHAQCMGLLADLFTPEQKARAFAALANNKGELAVASSYFAYYLFEAFARNGRTDLIRDRLSVWKTFLSVGAKTTFETQDIEARSDCHAWSACPLYFFQTAFAGVKPAAPFYKSVRIAPQPAGLKHIRAKTPCPQGLIETTYDFTGEHVSGTITLPAGLSGTFEWNGKTLPLKPGTQKVEL